MIMGQPGTITLDISLWDESKAEALIRKIRSDARVMGVTRLDIDGLAGDES